MLLTLAVNDPGPLVPKNGDPKTAVLKLPALAMEQFDLRGLNIGAAMLAGWSLTDLDQLRDAADKAGCPCLVLVEDQPLAFGASDEAVAAEARNRVERLIIAANRLGCNALAIRCQGDATDENYENTADALRDIMRAMDRMEVNLLLAPGDGVAESADELTDLIKRVGGFRIGSLPSFKHAADSGDLVQTLRKLAPYAGAIHATIGGFNKKGEHVGYDLRECVDTIRSVGFVNTLAIDYRGKDKSAMNDIETARHLLQAAIEDEGAGEEE